VTKTLVRLFENDVFGALLQDAPAQQDAYNRSVRYDTIPGAAIVGGGAGGHVTSPQHFGWGDAKVNVPPTDCPFSKIFRI